VSQKTRSNTLNREGAKSAKDGNVNCLSFSFFLKLQTKISVCIFFPGVLRAFAVKKC